MITRRAFTALAAAPLLGDERVKREVFVRSPRSGSAVIAQAFYTAREGGHMRSLEQHLSRSDTMDTAWLRDSTDHGETWGAVKERRTSERRAGGMWRLHLRPGFVDRSGRYLEFSTQAVLPSDDPLEGMRQWRIWYRVDDGPEQQVPHDGPAGTMAMLGDVSSVPVNAGDEILVPATVTTLGADGKLFNPTGGYTYTAAQVLHGKWQGGALRWRASEIVHGDPTLSTRGMDEPTLAPLPDGRVLMVLRGSNDRDPKLPARKWVSYSEDGGYRWSKPVPWSFHDRSPFFAPSAASQLYLHGDGRIFWLGHISPENARGNRPRYPLELVEVDRKTGLLRADRRIVIDGRAPGDPEILMIYPPFARPDRRTGEIVVHASRMVLAPENFAGDAMIYRVKV